MNDTPDRMTGPDRPAGDEAEGVAGRMAAGGGAPELHLAQPDEDAPDEQAPATPAGSALPDETVAGPAPTAEISTAQVIEAILFTAEQPLTPARIVGILGVGTVREVRNHIRALNRRYEEIGAAFRIEEIAGGFQMLTLSVFNSWLRRFKQSRQESRLSQAAMETLAVVAYRQPVVRAEIEAIRGVAAGEMLNRLRELGLIKIVGRAEDVGRPILYGTTRRFLEVFGLSSLEDLPAVEELKPPEN